MGGKWGERDELTAVGVHPLARRGFDEAGVTMKNCASIAVYEHRISLFSKQVPAALRSCYMHASGGEGPALHVLVIEYMLRSTAL